MSFHVRYFVLTAVFALICLPSWAQQNPLIGTWKSNPAKSKAVLGGPTTVNVNTYAASGPNGIKYTSDRVAADGTKSHFEFTANYDLSL